MLFGWSMFTVSVLHFIFFVLLRICRWLDWHGWRCCVKWWSSFIVVYSWCLQSTIHTWYFSVILQVHSFPNRQRLRSEFSWWTLNCNSTLRCCLCWILSRQKVIAKTWLNIPIWKVLNSTLLLGCSILSNCSLEASEKHKQSLQYWQGDRLSARQENNPGWYQQCWSIPWDCGQRVISGI